MKMRRWLLGGMVYLLLFQGCAESPQEDIVINKNEGKLEKAITKEKTKEDSQVIYEKYKDEFKVDAGQIEVSVNARIEQVQEKLPVVRVKPHMISKAEAKNYAEVLFDGQTAYEPQQYTKEEYEKKILELRERINNKEELLNQYGSQEEVDVVIKEFEKEIVEYEKQYQAAPEQQEKKECSWEFRPYGYYDASVLPTAGEDGYEALEKTEQIVAKTDGETEPVQILTVTNRNEEDYRLNNIWYHYENEEEFAASLPDKTITKDEAVEIGNQVVKELGLNDWKFQSYNVVKHTQQVFSLFYTPSYQGVPVFRGPLIDLKSEELYAANYYYPEITIGVKNGVFTDVSVVSPMEIVNIENSDVETLPFEEVYQAFKNQMQAQFTKTTLIDPEIPGIDEMDVEIRITKIQQGLFRIKEKNNQDEFLMIPVWSFYGTGIVDGGIWSEQEFVMVNALDGSIINTRLGY